MSDAVLIVRVRAPGEYRVLSVHPDEAWVWSLVGSHPWTGLVGTFRTSTSAEERTAAEDVGRRLVDEPDAAGGDLALMVSARGVDRRVAASSDLAGMIGDAFHALLDRARASPVSAFSVTARRSTPPGLPAITGLSVTSIGPEPVVLTLDPDTVSGRHADDSWTSLPHARMGLVSGDAELLDGIYSPARLEPGVVGGWVLPAMKGESFDDIRVSGTVTVVGPWPEGLPEPSFEAMVAVRGS